MMYMTPENALFLAKQHAQDMLREAEADRLCREARAGSAHRETRLLAPVRTALAVLVRISRQHAPEPTKRVEKSASGASLSMPKPTAS